MNPDPLVSFGMPVYNEAARLGEAIEGVLQQDRSDFELVIVDNASDDATGDIARRYAAQDGRIRYHRNPQNIGGRRNFNRAFGLARGKYFVWASGHDRRDPSFLSRCLQPLLEDPSVVLSYPQTVLVDADGSWHEIAPSRIDTRGLGSPVTRWNAVMWGMSVGLPVYGVIDAAAMRRTRLYRPVASPDITLLCELALIGPFAYVGEPLLFALRPPEHGDWDAYVAKHFESGLRGWRAEELFWRMALELGDAAWRHVPSPRQRVSALASVALGMAVKYRPVLHSLRSVGRT